MESWSSVWMWTGSLMVYIRWIYGEVEWKLYRYKKSMAVCVGYILWEILIVMSLIKLSMYGDLVILAVNMIYSVVFVKLVSEACWKKVLKYAGIILFLAFIGQSLFRLMSDLGKELFVGRIENFYQIYMLLGAGLSVITQKVFLEQGRAYLKKQQTIEQQFMEVMQVKEKMEFQEKQYTEMAEVYEEIRKIRHDIRNSFMIMDGLLEQGHIEEARNYLNLESAEMDKVPPIIQTDSVVISTLLNRFFQKARKLEVKISCKIITDFQGIVERDLCRVLGNLLDNALEATILPEVQMRYIDLNIQGNEHRMLIEIENSSDRKITDDIISITTTKEEEGHGLGLKNVKDIVERYDGNIEIVGDGRRVKVSLILFRKR